MAFDDSHACRHCGALNFATPHYGSVAFRCVSCDEFQQFAVSPPSEGPTIREAPVAFETLIGKRVAIYLNSGYALVGTVVSSRPQALWIREPDPPFDEQRARWESANILGRARVAGAEATEALINPESVEFALVLGGEG